jgi:hypothetical protein
MKTTSDSLVATCVYMVTKAIEIVRTELACFPVRALVLIMDNLVLVPH